MLYQSEWCAVCVFCVCVVYIYLSDQSDTQSVRQQSPAASLIRWLTNNMQINVRRTCVWAPWRLFWVHRMCVFAATMCGWWCLVWTNRIYHSHALHSNWIEQRSDFANTRKSHQKQILYAAFEIETYIRHMIYNDDVFVTAQLVNANIWSDHATRVWSRFMAESILDWYPVCGQ